MFDWFGFEESVAVFAMFIAVIVYLGITSFDSGKK